MEFLRRHFSDDANNRIPPLAPDIEFRMLEALEKLMTMVREVRSENATLREQVIELERRLADSREQT